VDSVSSLTPPKERDRGRDWDDSDLCDAIHSRDAHDRIESQHQEQDRLEREQRDERDSDYYGPFYKQPHQQSSPEGGHNPRGVKAISHDLKRVRWPLNFKPSVIEKYDGSTNPTEWLEVYELTIEATGGDL
jgi:hypothetical protein